MRDQPARGRALGALLAVVAMLGPACASGNPQVLDTTGGGPSESNQLPGNGGNGRSCAFDGTRREYDGTAEVELSYLDPLGESYDRTDHRTDAGVELGPPAEEGGVREPNAVHVEFGTVDQLAQGSFAGVSAVPFIDPENAEPTLYEFWTIQANCDRIGGTLSTSHSGEGFDIANTVFAERHLGPGLGFIEWSFRMAEGTTLAARVEGDRLELTVAGRDVEDRLDFTISVTATLA
jgi:hypothetical protein